MCLPCAGEEMERVDRVWSETKAKLSDCLPFCLCVLVLVFWFVSHRSA